MKVLVVEDNPRISELCAEALKRHDFLVEIMDDYSALLTYCQDSKFDVMLMDMCLGKNRTDSIVSSLRTLGIQTPIIMMSDLGTTDDRVRLLNLGADDFLGKYFSLDEMVARIKAVLRRRSGHKSNIIKCQDVVLNFSDCSVKRKNQDVYLSRKEFGILFELMTHHDQVVSRSEISVKVWANGDHQSNTIDVHIRSLRQKLANYDGARDFVETVRGRGYICRSK